MPGPGFWSQIPRSKAISNKLLNFQQRSGEADDQPHPVAIDSTWNSSHRLVACRYSNSWQGSTSSVVAALTLLKPGVPICSPDAQDACTWLHIPRDRGHDSTLMAGSIPL
jgi:hypothetical protein